MRALKRANRGLALIWDVDIIYDLLDVLGPYSASVNFSVVLSDGQVLHPSTVSELANLPETAIPQILEIRVQNESNSKTSARVGLQTQGGFSIYFHLEGDVKDRTVLENQLRRWVTKIERRNACIAARGFRNVAAVSASVLAFTLILFASSAATAPKASNIILGVGSALLLLIYALYRV